MRRVLTALAMIAACVFIATPAIAQDNTTTPSDPGSASESTPEETPPSQEELPPTDGPPTPSASEDPEGEPEAKPDKAVRKLADGEVAAAAKDPDRVRNITICHRTNAETNPYRVITVSAFSIVKDNGHDTHDGPVFEPGMKEQGIKWGDIIPEFDYSGGHYDGQNLGDGGDILANGCQVPGEEDDDDGTVDGDEDDDGEDGDGGDDGDDGDDDDKGNLPATGGGSPWILLTGGLLSVLGIAILSNGTLGREQVVGRHVKL